MNGSTEYCSLTFEKVVSIDHHIDILFSMLSDRKHRISHVSMPCYEDHKDFVINHPYRFWFLVKEDINFIGSVYVTNQNTIGININDDKLRRSMRFIIDKIKSEFEPLPAIKSIRAGHFSINTSPSNANFISALEAYGCRVSQVCFTV
jgi:hypothetical protein